MDEIDRALVPIRKKQERCLHTCFKCPKCGIYQDNLRDEQRLKIEYLINKLNEYEAVLTALQFSFIPYFLDEKYVKMNSPVTIVKIEIESRTETTILAE